MSLIAKALKDKGMTPAELARLCGVTQQMIKMIVSDEAYASIKLAKAIEKHLPITCRAIMHEQMERKIQREESKLEKAA